MQCPTDAAVLVMSERSGIEIDYCPTCRGVWLGRGELDKIIERAGQEFQSQPQQPLAPPVAPPQVGYPQQQQNPLDVLRQMGGRGDDRRGDDRGYGDRGYDDRRYDDRGGYGRKKKKDNWLSDLFD
ncbi:TFIIB-type zinc ribbon-containing protein [Agromyces aerolatus]|uniref:TFIIB-type zinc ribbon-containing protein n=1 Tax=Agromyces sp. LY-1074 TaxID=3074080 RepID=UPI00286698AE|nr:MULTISPECIES: zf-TFIIB domain-containing protein [unclassified Agromyces]MDR5698526.1 zf-TFIIB domain-containing protein [Agromyces sp. LY-1074]MDR5704820.1 zf-TFIIB domain-containing protein [Agromyces sp. LY-1358]